MSGPHNTSQSGSVLAAMGAARILSTKWRWPLGAGLLLTSACSTSVFTKGPAVKCDSGRNIATWKPRGQSPSSSSNHDKSDSPSPSNPKESHTPAKKLSDEQVSGWERLTQRLGAAKDSFGSAEWAEQLKNYIVPVWISGLPEKLQSLQRELSMAPGSLADDIWIEAQDASINPEITREATVRVSEEICREEQYFQWRRRRAIAKKLAAYLDLKEDVHPDDVPVIAMCGSGGGLRALIASTGSYSAAKEAGLWDCVMYTAGVSGSCWLQAIYHSSLGKQDFGTMIDHLKSRLGVHIAFPPHALNLLTTPPTHKYLLRSMVEKLKGDPNADFGLVDIYGLLLASRLLVSEGDRIPLDQDLKLSNQRFHIDSGAYPLPIYTAVRHEIPEIPTSDDSSTEGTLENVRQQAKRESWFQWFEFTPHELFCEELGAGIPIWALGRQFKGGKDVVPSHGCTAPELRIPALMGVWGSAFCATLAHYYKEIRPAFKGIAGFSGIGSLIEEKHEDLARVHPIDPATVPNFVLGLEGKLPESCPESIFKDSHLRLMDAGMSNNLPIYPLLRTGRDVDLIIAFDVSADLREENWLSVVDGYARQRGIKGWPMGIGWPKSDAQPEETASVLEVAEKSQLKTERGQQMDANSAGRVPKYPTQPGPGSTSDLTYCNIWVGTVEERTSTAEPPPSKMLAFSDSKNGQDENFHLMRPDAGVAVAYFPLLPNPAAPSLVSSASESNHASEDSKNGTSTTPYSDTENSVRPLDPSKDDFMSTWNFVYTPEQVDAVVRLAKANFAEGEDQVKRVVRGIYERKKKARLDRQREEDLHGLTQLS
ncbi:phospholipase [Emydomyces testavorans]|uniref:Lysophospholipase n=1 Tax=Emydomyces testavorans TaxID=2070801 RepID=A0AAF0DGI6_9EURO|nr:phospholipase [Emydomyces testavorans]